MKLIEGMLMRVTRYQSEQQSLWDPFVAESRNGTFLFQRGYLEYHADRFEHFSLLIWKDEALVAVLPGSRHGEEWRSHGGLTYGGFVAGRDFRAAVALEALEAVTAYLAGQGIKRLLFKPVPHIYHRMPAEEELYALFRCGARLVRRDLSSSLWLANRYGFSKGRKSSLSKARREGVEVGPSDDWEAFMAMEAALLMEKHGVRPVHAAAEIRLLAGRFPANIRLATATRQGRLLAGMVTYTTDTVCHAQYIASTPEGRDCGAVDAVGDFVIRQAAVPWFDFGISTTDQGRVLDAALASNKEGYGARATCYDHYQIDL
jgi:hypothetical protein